MSNLTLVSNYTVSSGNGSVNGSVTAVPVWIAYRQALTIFFIIMFFLELIGGMLSFLIITAICSSKKLRSGAGTLILNVFILNFIQIAILMPLMSFSMYYPDHFQQYQPEFCQYHTLFYFSNEYAVEWGSIMVALNRFVALIFPHSYRKWTSKKVTILMAVISSIIPLASNLTVLLKNEAKFTITKPWRACGIIATPGSKFYEKTIMTNVGFPIATEAALYISIFSMIWIRSLLRSRRIGNGQHEAVKDTTEQQKQAVFERRYKSAKILFTSALWYAICLLPAPIGSGSFPKEYNSQPLLQLFFRILLALGYATTPIIYLSRSKDYRHGVLKILKKVYCVRPLIRETGVSIAGTMGASRPTAPVAEW